MTLLPPPLPAPQHPDRGGELTTWQLTVQCHSLLREPASLQDYVRGRNHEEHVAQLKAGEGALSGTQRVAQVSYL